MKNREAGFSGFETAITLLVIAIIAVVGFSVYSRQTHKLPIISDNTPKVRTVSKPKVSRIGSDKDLNFAIKGDAKLGYPKIKKIMDILQDQDINTFDLVTGLRGKDY